MKHRNTAILIILLAAVSSLLSVFIMNSVANSEITNAVKIEVIVATEDLPVGTVLTDRQLEGKTVFRESVDSKVFRLNQKEFIVGKTLNFPARKGGQISWMHIGTVVEESNQKAEDEVISVIETLRNPDENVDQ